MCKLLCLFPCLFVFYIFVFTDASFHQERAHLNYWNPKYVANCSVFTARRRRNAPYLTNVTGETLVPFGNNISVAISFEINKREDVRMAFKLCDSLKVVWVRKTLSMFTDIPIECPLPARQYNMLNLEIPPHNIPMPKIEGDYVSSMKLFTTAEKELILDIVTKIKFKRSNRERS